MTRPPEDFVRHMNRVADEMNRRIQTVHERLPCPLCRAPVGERCRRMPIGYHGMDRCGKELAHAHRERWSQEVPPR